MEQFHPNNKMTDVLQNIYDPVVVTAENREAVLEGTPFFFKLACNLCSRIKYGAIIVILPNGRAIKFLGETELESEGVIIVKNYAFARRSLLGGDIGFFESFADDQWETPSIADCLYVFARNADYVMEAFLATPIIAWLDQMRHSQRRNTKIGARRNIMAHYDLGNAFYEKWLDSSMTYSSALYPAPNVDLSLAQANKYRMLAERIDLKAGQTVLEIGSGWGGFAEYAAKEVGAMVTGVTISEAQFEYASQRIQKAGLANHVEFRLQDYRDIEGQFDKIASIEMFEAVGKEYWPAFFEKVHATLSPGGLAGLQVITIADRFYDTYQQSTDFIQRYVFPGGMLPSLSILRAQVERAGLAWRDAAPFGGDYALTLKAWHERFISAWDEIQIMGFDERFKKLWRFYLGYCEAGFRAETTNVIQLVAVRA